MPETPVVTPSPSSNTAIDITTAIGNAINESVLLLVVVLLIIIQRTMSEFINNVTLRFNYDRREEFQLNSVLSQVLALCEAERVLLLEFHNGEVTSSGRHLNKVSATFEVTSPGVSQISYDFQKIPTSYINEYLTTLESSSSSVYQVSKMAPGHLKKLLINSGVNYTVLYLVKGYDNMLLGILMVNFDKSNSHTEQSIQESLADINSLITSLEIVIDKSRRNNFLLTFRTLWNMHKR